MLYMLLRVVVKNVSNPHLVFTNNIIDCCSRDVHSIRLLLPSRLLMLILNCSGLARKRHTGVPEDGDKQAVSVLKRSNRWACVKNCGACCYLAHGERSNLEGVCMCVCVCVQYNVSIILSLLTRVSLQASMPYVIEPTPSSAKT